MFGAIDIPSLVNWSFILIHDICMTVIHILNNYVNVNTGDSWVCTKTAFHQSFLTCYAIVSELLSSLQKKNWLITAPWNILELYQPLVLDLQDAGLISNDFNSYIQKNNIFHFVKYYMSSIRQCNVVLKKRSVQGHRKAFGANVFNTSNYSRWILKIITHCAVMCYLR